MNERIRELWEQAAESTAAYPSGQNNSWETQVNFMEKFAELIVAECLDIVEDEDDGSVDTKAVRWAMIRIKKHFGVEE